MAADVERYRNLVRRLVGGRKVVLAGSPLAACARQVSELRDLGADRCLCIAGNVGTGDLPDPADADRVTVDVDAPDLVTSNRRRQALLAAPPPEVNEALDRFDPDGDALVLVAPFLTADRLGERAVYGGRRSEWVALEDKTHNDAFFDDVGVSRPPSQLTRPERKALVKAGRSLDLGRGTVWAGDARDGFNGGGEYVRWIRHEVSVDVDEAVTFFAARCDQVRVAPFVEGLPCSIHGVVTEDGVAVLRPVELVMLRPPTGSRFRYAGAGTFWDPPPADREAMREVARRVGRALADRVGFRGAFGVDGILSEDGFVPTELNPRFAAGLGYVMAALPELPFSLVHHLLAAGDGEDFDAAGLDSVILEAADRRRWGAGWTTVERCWLDTRRHPVVVEGDGDYRLAGEDEEPHATLMAGPSATGGFLRVAFAPQHRPGTRSMATSVVAAFALADEVLDAGIGPLAPPAEVR